MCSIIDRSVTDDTLEIPNEACGTGLFHATQVLTIEVGCIHSTLMLCCSHKVRDELVLVGAVVLGPFVDFIIRV